MGKFKVIVDTREKTPWEFEESELCEGTVRNGLKTGDYSIEGFEGVLSIERKRNVAEIAGNIIEERFDRELERLNEFPYAYLILEFTADDVLAYPYGSGLPPKLYNKVKLSGNFIMSKLLGYMFKYPNIKVIFAGTQGKRIAEFIFKKVIKNG